jgi:hypothetical protein
MPVLPIIPSNMLHIWVGDVSSHPEVPDGSKWSWRWHSPYVGTKMHPETCAFAVWRWSILFPTWNSACVTFTTHPSDTGCSLSLPLSLAYAVIAILLVSVRQDLIYETDNQRVLMWVVEDHEGQMRDAEAAMSWSKRQFLPRPVHWNLPGPLGPQ